MIFTHTDAVSLISCSCFELTILPPVFGTVTDSLQSFFDFCVLCVLELKDKC